MAANKLGLPSTTHITHFFDRHFMFVFDMTGINVLGVGCSFESSARGVLSMYKHV